MNGYFTIVLLAVILFFVVWALGWFLERLSHIALQTTRNPGSRAWNVLVGPGVALHETSHALGCVVTRTPIVEFKPLNVSVQEDQIILGYVSYRKPKSALVNAVINLAPVGVSLVLLTLFALGATYLVPQEQGIGGAAIQLLQNLIWNAKTAVDPYEPLSLIGTFIYDFFYSLASLTVINPIFWIVAFLAMTIMFSNAPSEVDIRNAATGLKLIIIFDLIWLIVAYFVPAAGWVLFGFFELLAVMFTLAATFAVVAYGFFIMITAMSNLRTPFNIIPFLVCIGVGILLWNFAIGTPAFQTMVSLGAFVAVVLPMLAVKGLRVK